MRITNRLPDRRATHAFALGTSALGAFGVLLAAASCSTTSVMSVTTDDANDASLDAEAREASVADAGADGDTPDAVSVDAATSDAGPPAIQCADTACAKSLVMNGNWSFCALLDDATVTCWGKNLEGQLARDSSVYMSAVPERVPGLKDIVRLSHTCAVDKDGAAWCWGTGPFLQSTTAAWSTERTPVRLAIPTASHVDFPYYDSFSTAFYDYTPSGCAALGDAGVACWGRNVNGQVRPPTVGEDMTAANPVTTVDIPEGAPIQDIFVGSATLLLRTDGTLLSWGAKPMLGRVSSLSPDPRPKPIPLTGVTYVDAEEGNACVVARGSVYCWGTTDPVGGDTLSNALPRQVVLPELAVSVATTGARYAGNVGAADPQRGCAVTLSGDVYCWDSNTSGQAGDGTRDTAFSPVKVKGLPGPASIVRTAALTTCALLTTGKVYCWGEDGNGELGNGVLYEPSLTPVEVLLP